MRRRRDLVLLAGAVAVWSAVPVGVAGAAAARTGPGVLSAGANAQVLSVSCGSAGSCSAGGYYTDRSGHLQGFVAVERNGVWGRATGVPGLGALNTGGFARVSSVSCSSAGNCAATGSYRGRSGHLQLFVTAERNGVWGRAAEVTGLGASALIAPGYAQIVSCGSAGNCAAAGSYYDRSFNLQGFVVVERKGVWGRAAGVPGLGTLNAGGLANVSSLSCDPAGSCAAGGSYTDRSGDSQGFVASERAGAWGRATGVPGLGTLNKLLAGVLSVSCGPAGSCAAGGSYTDRSGHRQGFVVSQRNGLWGRATAVPGLAALNAGRGQVVGAQVGSVSCASAGNCTAGGYYTDRRDHVQAFVAVERNGAWGRAAGVPGLAALNTGGSASVDSVSCAPAGNCTAGGQYTGKLQRRQGWVATEQNGRWGKATGIPGLAALNTGKDLGADIISLSCGRAGSCAAGGYYTARGGHLRGFVAIRRNGIWGQATALPGTATS